MGKMEIKNRSEVEIKAPLGESPKGYCSAHIDISRLTQDQAAALYRLRGGLDKQGAKLANGRRVVSNSDVIRWLLERAI